MVVEFISSEASAITPTLTTGALRYVGPIKKPGITRAFLVLG
jgi:hypothetical protein